MTERRRLVRAIVFREYLLGVQYGPGVRGTRPLLIVVFNDAAYGGEVHHLAPEGLPVDLVRFLGTDLAALAGGAGAGGVTVRGSGDLTAVEGWLRDRSVPLLVDAKVVPTVVAAWLPEAFVH